MRTFFLGSLAAAAVAGMLPAAHAQTLPVTIVNSTGITGKMYVTVLGKDPATGKTYIYSDAAGNVKTFTAASTTPTDYGFNTTAATFNFKIPQMNSARIYVSFCQPAWTTVSLNGDKVLAPNTPAPWVPTDKNFGTVLDFAEFDWVPKGNSSFMDIDTTQVDTLGIPIKMTLQNAGQTLNSGFNDKPSSLRVVPAFAMAPWSKLVVSDAKKRPIRIIVPEKAMALPTSHPNYFPNTYWDNYITQVFTTFAKQGKSFIINGDDGLTYTGTIVNNRISLKPSNGGAPTVFGKPSSIYVWQNGAPYVSGPSAPTPSLQKYIQAAFLRSTFLNPTTNNISTCNGVVPYALPPQNLYSSTIHALSLNQGAYTFPYDDVCAHSSNIALTAPTKLTLTLFPLSTTWSNMACAN